MHADCIDDLLPVIHRLAVERQQPVTGLQAGSLGRAFGVQFSEDGRQCRTPGTNAQGANWIRLISALEPFVQHQLTRRIHCGALLTNHQLQ
ncbi:hypothetical protein D3C76_1349310 [compost metagenome]